MNYLFFFSKAHLHWGHELGMVKKKIIILKNKKKAMGMVKKKKAHLLGCHELGALQHLDDILLTVDERHSLDGGELGQQAKLLQHGAPFRGADHQQLATLQHLKNNIYIII